MRSFESAYQPMKNKILGNAILVDTLSIAIARKYDGDTYTRDGYVLFKHGLVDRMPTSQREECLVIGGAQEYKTVQRGILLATSTN